MAQQGVDLIALKLHSVSVGQCKCYKNSDDDSYIVPAVEEFIEHIDYWASHNVRIFRLYIAHPASHIRISEAILKCEQLLAAFGIGFSCCDARYLHEAMRGRPDLVQTFFPQLEQLIAHLRIDADKPEARLKETISKTEYQIYRGGRVISENLLSLPGDSIYEKNYLEVPCELNADQPFAFWPSEVETLMRDRGAVPLGILGTPGGGKTFALARLYQFLLDRYLNDAGAPVRRLPVYLRVSDCIATPLASVSLESVRSGTPEQSSVLRHIVSAIAKTYLVKTDEALKFAQSPHVVFLFDNLESLDTRYPDDAPCESSASDSAYLTPIEFGLHAIRDLSAQQKVVFTCRQTEWDSIRPELRKIDTLRLLPLKSPRKLYQLLTGAQLPSEFLDDPKLLESPLFLGIAIQLTRLGHHSHPYFWTLINKKSPNDFIRDYVDILLSDTILIDQHSENPRPLLGSGEEVRSFCKNLAFELSRSMPTASTTGQKDKEGAFSVDHMSPERWLHTPAERLFYRILFGAMVGCYLGALTSAVNFLSLLAVSSPQPGQVGPMLGVSLANGGIAVLMITASYMVSKNAWITGALVGASFVFARALVLISSSELAHGRSLERLVIEFAPFVIPVVAVIYARLGFQIMNIELNPMVDVRDKKRRKAWIIYLISGAVLSYGFLALLGNPIGGLAIVLSLIAPFAYFLLHRSEAPEMREKVNQLIVYSLKRASLLAFVCGGLGALIHFFVWSIGTHSVGEGLINAALGLCLFNAFFAFGGTQVFQHYALRTVVAARGRLPLFFTQDLRTASDRRILKRVGIQYEFFHALGLKHFLETTEGPGPGR